MGLMVVVRCVLVVIGHSNLLQIVDAASAKKRCRVKWDPAMAGLVSREARYAA
jgi:hypothetical protein